MNELKQFSNRVVLVTGASGGMGRAISGSFAEHGADIVLADVSEDVLLDLATQLKAEGTRVEVLAGDLTDKQYSNQLPEMSREIFDRLDIVINNAGLMRRGAITNTSDEDYALSMAVNVEAPFRICRSAIPIMAAAGGGKIVNIASCWGLYPGPDHLIYCTTKAALATMTRCLGRDHAHQNIRVNAVCPNEVDTPMLRTGFEIRGLNPAQAVNQLNETVPLGRIADPQEIANVVRYLACDESSYVCGSLIEVNGAKPVY